LNIHVIFKFPNIIEEKHVVLKAKGKNRDDGHDDKKKEGKKWRCSRFRINL